MQRLVSGRREETRRNRQQEMLTDAEIREGGRDRERDDRNGHPFPP